MSDGTSKLLDDGNRWCAEWTDKAGETHSFETVRQEGEGRDDFDSRHLGIVTAMKREYPPAGPSKAAMERWLLQPVGDRWDIETMIERKRDEISELVGEAQVARFFQIVKAQSRRQVELMACTRESMIGAVLFCALTGLMPGEMGHLYLIPRRNKHVRVPDPDNPERAIPALEVTTMVGYKGYLKLARSHPDVVMAEAGVVYEGDEFHHDKGRHVIHHVKNVDDQDRRPETVTNVWSRVYVRGAEALPYTHSMNRQEIEAVRAKSQKPHGSFWKEHYAAMARKSVVRAHYNGGEIPLTDAMETAIARELAQDFADEKPADVVAITDSASATEALKRQLGVEPTEPQPAAPDPQPPQTERDMLGVTIEQHRKRLGWDGERIWSFARETLALEPDHSAIIERTLDRLSIDELSRLANEIEVAR